MTFWRTIPVKTCYSEGYGVNYKGDLWSIPDYKDKDKITNDSL